MAFVRVKSSMDLWRSYTKDRTKAHEIMCAVVKTGIVSTQLLNIPVLIQEIRTFIKWATKQSSQSFWMQRSSESSEWIPSEILSGWKVFRFDHPHDERPAISHGISRFLLATCCLVVLGRATGFIASYRCSNFCGPVLLIHTHSHPGPESSSWVFQGP